MKNCILWDNSQQLMEKINSVDDTKYQKMSQEIHDWSLTKTCEESAKYVMENI